MMLKHFARILFLVGAVGFASPSARALGGYVGNGGDVVICTPYFENSFNGAYALDFIATYQPSTDAALIKATSAPPNYLQFDPIKMSDPGLAGNAWWVSIYRKLFRVSRDMAEQYRDFVSMIYVGSKNRTVFWNDATFGLVDIKDEALAVRIPPNCSTPSPSGPKLYQAIIRQKLNSLLQFSYDKKLVQSLTSDLQFSYLMLHEFLWSHTADVETIRFINRFVHSGQIDSITAEDFGTLMANAGVRHFGNGRKPKTVELGLTFGTIELIGSMHDGTIHYYTNPRYSGGGFKIQLLQGKNRRLAGKWTVPGMGGLNLMVDTTKDADPFDPTAVLRVIPEKTGTPQESAITWRLSPFFF